MSNVLMIYALPTGWCALESIDTEIKHLDNWLIDWIHSLHWYLFMLNAQPFYITFYKLQVKSTAWTPARPPEDLVTFDIKQVWNVG